MRIRRPAKKRHSARSFSKRRSRTNIVNLKNPPMRGGIRL